MWRLAINLASTEFARGKLESASEKKIADKFCSFSVQINALVVTVMPWTASITSDVFQNASHLAPTAFVRDQTCAFVTRDM